MLFITTALAASVAVLAATLYKKDRDSDYQERLREAYDGLSPDGGEY